MYVAAVRNTVLAVDEPKSKTQQDLILIISATALRFYLS
jgi:hypothetical protein